MMTPRVAQAALHFGADDMDGTVVSEEIFHKAGASSPQTVTRGRLMALIEETGRVPVERDTLYNPIGSPVPSADDLSGQAAVGSRPAAGAAV
jgi:aminodeoxyfutalosine synthase